MKIFFTKTTAFLCTLNRLAILVFAALGIDVISNKYHVPWQVIGAVMLILLVLDFQNKKKIDKEYNDFKINSFIEKNREKLTDDIVIQLRDFHK